MTFFIPQTISKSEYIFQLLGSTYNHDFNFYIVPNFANNDFFFRLPAAYTQAPELNAPYADYAAE